MKNLFARMVLLLVCGILFPSCAGKSPLPPWAAKLSIIKAPAGPDEIFKLPDGDPTTFARLLDDLDSARVIFVGESHDQIEHHQIQVRMIDGLLAKGKEVVIGMEMFEKSQQATLDQWSQGLLTEEEFLEESQWEKTWGMDNELYKGILDAAKTRHLKILGLNVPRDWVRTVAEKGLQGLSPEIKKLLPEMDLANRQHRAYIATIFKGHDEGSAKALENFYEAQCLWDEGMAQSLSEFLESPQAKGKTVLVFAGSGHIVFGFGIPNRLYRRTPVPSQAVVLKTWSKKMNGDLAFTRASSPFANFVWITNPNPPEKKKPRIGVILKQPPLTPPSPHWGEGKGEGGLIIDKVLPGSPAEKAGLLPGDQLIDVEGIEIRDVKEIHHALSEKGWGNNITFTIIREGMEKEVTVTLPSGEDR